MESRLKNRRNGHAAALPADSGTPPHDLLAERALLSSMIIDPRVIDDICCIARANDLYVHAHRILWRAIVARHMQGSRPDATLLHADLNRADQLEEIGGLGFLLEVVDSAPHAGNAEHYAKVVRELSLRREAMRRGRDIIDRAASDSISATSLIEEAAQTFQGMLSEVVSDSRFEILSAAELDCAGQDISYLVEGVLVEGQPCLVGGVQKTLKTSFAIALFVSLATGAKFLGRFNVNRQCRTLLLSGESGRATIKETARRIAAADGFSLADVDGLNICTTLPRLDRSADLAELKQVIRQKRIEVIGIDPVYLCMPATDTMNLFAQGQMLRRISELCEAERATLVLVHHAKKGAGNCFETIELADLAYSGFAEFARQWLLLSRREKYLPGTGNHRLWLSVGGSAGHNSTWAVDIVEGEYSPGSSRVWGVAVRHPDEVQREANERMAAAKIENREQRSSANRDAAKSRVIACLTGEPQTYRQLRAQSALGDGRLRAALDELMSSAEIQKTEVKRNGRAEIGYMRTAGTPA